MVEMEQSHPLTEQNLIESKFGVYVHIPFCASRCGYCDFNTYAPKDGIGVSPEEYIAGVVSEIAFARQQIKQDLEISTIFFGGGTPTLLSARLLGEVLKKLTYSFRIAEDVEITTEANPETLTENKLLELLELGFNRISLGLQSTNVEVLKILDRVHTPKKALQFAVKAKELGFNSVNLDLIYGTPGETTTQLSQTLADVLAIGVEHISAYSLIVENGTALARKIKKGLLEATSEDLMAQKYEFIDETLLARGYHNYEVSNWSKPGHECKHNLNYWLDHNWWGFGAGAHSHFVNSRWWNHKHPRRYLDAIAVNGGVSGAENLSESDRLLERVMLQIRLAQGLPLELLPDPQKAQKIVELGLAEITEEKLLLNRKGRLLADGLVPLLI